MLALYHSPFSVSSQKVRMVLAEKNISWEDNQVDLLTGGQFKPEFVTLNPKAEVPVLVHDDKVLTESSVINEYLEERFEGTRLMPVEAWQRYQVRFAVAMIDGLIHRASGVLTYAVLARPLLAQVPSEQLELMFSQTPNEELKKWRRSVLTSGLAAPEVAAALDQHRDFFAFMESRLVTPQSWMAGDAFSLADIAALPYVMRAEHLGLGDLFSVAELPNLRSWYMRMLIRPSMKPSFLDYVDASTQELLMNLVVAAQPQLAEMMQPA